MTLIGNRPEWVLAMLACFRIGAVVLPCTEQLRAKDLRLRIEVARPALIIADERNGAELRAGRPPRSEVLLIPDETPVRRRARAGGRARRPRTRALITFTSGTVGRAEGGRPRPALPARPAPAGEQLARPRRRRAGVVHGGQRLVEVGPQRVHRALAAGAVALLHDARFDPHERLELLERERVNVLCMAPTEYRVIAKRADAPRRCRTCAGWWPPARR